MKILVIEDEKLLADSIKEMLGRKGFEVECVYDGETGKEYAELGIYDLLILDVMMPKMDGYEVARQVRMNRCNTPILMLTAKSDVADRIAGHHHIQNQQIINTKLGIFLSGFTVIDALHLKAFPFQHFLNGLCQQLFIFNHQNLHNQSSKGTICHYNTVFTLRKAEESEVYSYFTGNCSFFSFP